MFDYDKWLENYKEEQRVRCPYCKFDISYDGDSMIIYENGISVSYHGWPDEKDSIVECPECGETFKVREHVRRTYDTCKDGEDFE